jgi:hypothetical protein
MDWLKKSGLFSLTKRSTEKQVDTIIIGNDKGLDSAQCNPDTTFFYSPCKGIEDLHSHTGLAVKDEATSSLRVKNLTERLTALEEWQRDTEEEKLQWLAEKREMQEHLLRLEEKCAVLAKTKVEYAQSGCPHCGTTDTFLRILRCGHPLCGACLGTVTTCPQCGVSVLL